MKKLCGKLFVFEGIDHVGKTTIVSTIKNILENRGVSCSAYSFPGKKSMSLGALIYDIHHNQGKYFTESINPISLQLLHIAAHVEGIYKYIIPDLKMGKIVLLDRSWWSTYAYGIAFGINQDIIKRIISPEKFIFKDIKVTRYFLIKRENVINDYDPEITRLILNSYDNISKDVQKQGDLTIINNNSSIHDAVTTVLNIIIDKHQLNSNEIVKNDIQKEYNKSVAINHINLYPSVIYDAYWKFAAKRQDIFFDRFNGKSLPWTDDHILQKYKFTNAYRASDRVSQFLIKNVIYNNQNQYSPEDIIFRIILFKLFNRIDTWRALEKSVGDILLKNYSYEKYNNTLLSLLENEQKIYSAAYIMPSGKSDFGFTKKHQNNLKLLELMMKDHITKKISKAKSLKQMYEILLSYPTIGKFLAFQYAIDINYSELCDFDEMSFVVAGPGACNGIQKCFEDSINCSEDDIIRYMAASQFKEFERLGLKFKTLWGRPLQLIDCQNLFCEIDKYARVAFPNKIIMNGHKRIKQQFRPNLKERISYYYPPKWRINELIRR